MTALFYFESLVIIALFSRWLPCAVWQRVEPDSFLTSSSGTILALVINNFWNGQFSVPHFLLLKLTAELEQVVLWIDFQLMKIKGIVRVSSLCRT